jgi:hypothetical protein
MPTGKDKTPGFSMSACIKKVGKARVSSPGAVCQSIYQRVKAGEIRNGFPEKPSRKSKK